MKKPTIPPEVMEFFRKSGASGGKTRAAKYTKEQLSEMGRKGGRPKGSVANRPDTRGENK